MKRIEYRQCSDYHKARRGFSSKIKKGRVVGSCVAAADRSQLSFVRDLINLLLEIGDRKAINNVSSRQAGRRAGRRDGGIVGMLLSHIAQQQQWWWWWWCIKCCCPDPNLMR